MLSEKPISHMQEKLFQPQTERTMETDTGHQPITVRMATYQDLEAIYECERACFDTAWTYAMLYDDIVENQNTVYLVVEKEEEIIGYGGMWVVLDEAHITNVCIKPEYRGRGYAHQLMKGLTSASKSCGVKGMTLEVRVSNKPALKLYRKCGFTIQGIRKKYYQNSEDAYVMWTERDTFMT